jgi:hypothetical protein
VTTLDHRPLLLVAQQREILRVDELLEHGTVKPARRSIPVLRHLGAVDHRPAR